MGNTIYEKYVGLLLCVRTQSVKKTHLYLRTGVVDTSEELLTGLQYLLKKGTQTSCFLLVTYPKDLQIAIARYCPDRPTTQEFSVGQQNG